LTAGDQWVDALHPPGAKQESRGHLDMGAPWGASTAADLAADDQVSQAALGGPLVRIVRRFSTPTLNSCNEYTGLPDTYRDGIVKRTSIMR